MHLYYFCGKFLRKFFSSFQAQTNNSDNTPAYNSFLHTVCDINIKLCVFYVYIFLRAVGNCAENFEFPGCGETRGPKWKFYPIFMSIHRI